MFKTKQLFNLFFSAIFFFAIFGGFVFAQERNLEVPLPAIGEGPGITVTPFLPDYVKYIFNFAIGIGGLLSFGILVYGGLRFLTSAGDPSKMSDAKDQIFSALLGLIVLLGSWIVLTTVNPELVKINPLKPPSTLPPGSSPGVYLCKTEYGSPESGDCELFLESRPELGDLNDKVGYIKFSNPDGESYGAVLHENAYQKGTCQIYTSDGPVTVGGGLKTSLPNGEPSSITVFRKGKPVGGIGAIAFDDKEYETDRGHYDFVDGEYHRLKDLVPPEFQDCAAGIECRPVDSKMSSLKVNKGHMAVLFGDDDYGGSCAVFFDDISALGPTAVGNDQVSSMKVMPASP